MLKSKETPQEVDLKKINRYTRREFQAEEVYTFSVLLCDNEIDRDGERFTVAALEKLAGLFLGKTGIFNHSMQAQNQTARIYDCEVERDSGRTTQCGEPYTRLVGKAYLPRSEKNSDFILELESGIKKEVSVGCAVAKTTCSICGADLKKDGCAHRKGRTYEGKICCTVLDEPTDAYEWSFVAVPAQREAGVIKSFCGVSGSDAGEILKAMAERGAEITLSAEQGKALLDRMERLKDEAECGKSYRAELQKSLVRFAGIAQPEIPAEVMNRVAEGMGIEDLKCMAKAYRRRADEILPLAPQLAGTQKPEKSGGNTEFRI